MFTNLSVTRCGAGDVTLVGYAEGFGESVVNAQAIHLLQSISDSDIDYRSHGCTAVERRRSDGYWGSERRVGASTRCV